MNARASAFIAAPADPLMAQAVEFCREAGAMTTSALSACLIVSYGRAANIMEALTQRGILSEMDEHGKRRVIA